ncbi:2-oxoacid:acceptor oxidoreductase family protein [Mailhella massiliensis]|uniref:2-oxoacid:acceptor oxidoreductase family protein n=1 Tax=Mailhella massiliensis TaxID=1903261 RepID=A0A921AX17_9BACT|nr:2-oxoacid:acceptor oxidoreductase family protein [Mailhella massiliensis]HJD97703.1 2-oxoacid:acceptor oxidoreductase family protein [Mailhella massiliensis]
MEKYRFLLSGSGGQGIITMAILLAEAAAIYDNLTAVQSQVYGPEARGGATRSDVIISDSPILFPKVTQPGILVALNQSSFMKYGNLIRPGGLLLTDSHLVYAARDLDVRHIALPLHETVLRELGGAQSLNICTLGALVALTRAVRPESVEKVLARRFPAAVESNLKALRLGLALGEGARDRL